MNTDPHPSSAAFPGGVKITTVLRIEHRLLHEMMEAMSEWLAKAPASAGAAMRERVALLAIALETHAIREEKYLLAQLRPLSEPARQARLLF